MSGGLFYQLLGLLTAAAVTLAVFHRLHLPPTLAYLVTGTVVGPGGLALITEQHGLERIAELGVVFLLFSLGLEFSLARLSAMRRQVLALGGSQVLVCVVVFMGAGVLLGLTPDAAFVAGAALALSSTAVVMRELARRNELGARHGQLGVAVLLFQDLAAVVLLIVIPALGGDAEDLTITLALTLAKGVALFVFLLAVGRWVLPRVFFVVARTHLEELFVLTALTVTLLAAVLTEAFGLSMALGAFIAGMMLGESHYRYQIEAEIRPFRDVLLGIFFISVGMLLDLGTLAAHWPQVLGLGVALIAFKTVVIAALGFALGEDRTTAVRAALVLAQGGEFGFAMLALATAERLLDPALASTLVAAVVLSMGVTPVVVHYNRQIAERLLRHRHPPPAIADGSGTGTAPFAEHVLICGFGRVGQTVARVLRRAGVPYVAADPDPVRVREAVAAGEPIHFGDAKHAALLRRLGVERARLAVISFSDVREALAILATLRRLRADLPVLVRTPDDRHLDALRAAGATDIVPETLEASLTLVSHVLALLDFPHQAVQESVQGVREDRYRILHGYFHGQRSRVADAHGEALEKLHAVALPARAWAVGRPVTDLGLERIGATVHSVRRDGGAELLPTADLTLGAGDVVVLHGSAHQVEAGEARLLGG